LITEAGIQFNFYYSLLGINLKNGYSLRKSRQFSRQKSPDRSQVGQQTCEDCHRDTAREKVSIGIGKRNTGICASINTTFKAPALDDGKTQLFGADAIAKYLLGYSNSPYLPQVLIDLFC
jgi:hypothetical protein